jgi:signal transduction histidine kinase
MRAPAPAGRARRLRWYGRLQAIAPPLLDGLLALFVTGVVLASLVGRAAEVVETDSGTARFTSPDALGIGLLLVSTVSIGWRRRAPLVVLLVTSVATFAYHQAGYAPPPLPYGPLLALYALSAVWIPVRSAAAVAVLVFGVVVLFLTRHSPITDDEFLTYVVSICLTWGLGCGVQLNRARTTLLEEKAVQLARERDANAKLAVEQERARIARELHDIVSHHVSVMVALASGVQRIFGTEPEEGLRTLRSIETVGREALVAMRRMLGLLQSDPDGGEDGAQPGLEHLAGLLARVVRAGLPVDLVVRGEARRLPPEVDVNAYRIVQEALTNALRHAGPARARVLIDYEDDVVRLSIRDTGDGGREQAAAGRGLIGILHRVTVLGGRLVVGPLASGGFEVTADVPVKGISP